jgi:hypothetical protein
MSKLNQVIAIEKGVKARAHSVVSDLYKVIQKPDLFNGAVRTYQKKDDDGEDLPGERKHVQFRTQDVLGTVRMSTSELIDLTAQKDIANTEAKAEVSVGGTRILPELPVSTLLFLEKQLTDLRTFVEALPVLDNAESWSLDVNSGLYKTDAVQTSRTKKVQRPLVLFPATPEHPAQTQLVTEDVIAGFWSTIRQSAAMPKPEKEAISGRIEKLLIGVKEARERANDTDAGAKPAIGAAIFEYLLGKQQG